MNKSLLYVIIAVVVVAVIGAIALAQRTNNSITTPPTQSTATPTASGSASTIDVSSHNTKDDCWTKINGKVYNVTAFFGEHPGGDQNLLRACGIDATALFATQGGEGSHSGQALEILSTFEVK